MSDEALTPAQEEAQTHIDAIRDPAHPQHAAASADPERWYKQRWSEPGEDGRTRDDAWSELRTRVTEKYAAKEDAGKGVGALSPRAVIAAINAELEQNRGHQTEQRRQQLLRQRDRAYQQDHEESERAAATARAEQAAPRDQGVAPIVDVGAAPEGQPWNTPVVGMLAEDLVGRRVVSEDVFTQLARRGTALFTARQAKGQREPARLNAAQRDDLAVVMPDRLQRQHLVDFVERTGLADDDLFDTILTREADARRKEQEGARVIGLKLATMNQGSKEYAALAEQRNAHFKRFYEGAAGRREETR